MEDRCLDEVLGLSRSCPQEEIRSAYKRLALQLHPDKIPVSQKRWRLLAFRSSAMPNKSCQAPNNNRVTTFITSPSQPSSLLQTLTLTLLRKQSTSSKP
ncbi:hypothetical protein AMTR_s00110p00131050 [Amborella trichopoda]|uniref:J domain-containing protein n=1 Tax=Amborella trichopoda TaxID=13333 RepID=W1NZ53_AMBTC|nr:hypothetical protein AMTR_s00110p00131050 [Amborella trichopoda]